MGKRIRQLRDAAGISQAKLAKLVDVQPRTVQNWEYGKGTFDFETAIRLSEALGCTLYDLAGLDAPPEAPAPKRKGAK